MNRCCDGRIGDGPCLNSCAWFRVEAHRDHLGRSRTLRRATTSQAERGDVVPRLDLCCKALDFGLRDLLAHETPTTGLFVFVVFFVIVMSPVA